MKTKKKFNKYRKPQSLQEQVELLANVYLRHGSKVNRRKQVKQLVVAVERTGARYGLNNVNQMGKRQVRWFDEQLRQEGMSNKTRLNYWRGWRLLWSWLQYIGEPPRPK